MIASRLLFLGLRAIERACPPPLLAAVVWPGLATLGIAEACGSLGRQYRRRVARVHGARPGLWKSWQHAVDRLSMRLVCLWPERFLVNPWRSRLSITGLDEVRDRLTAGTPVVFGRTASRWPASPSLAIVAIATIPQPSRRRLEASATYRVVS